MKRTLSLLLILMVVAALVACNDPTPTPTPTPTSAPTPSCGGYEGIHYPKNINPSKENWEGKTLSIFGREEPTSPADRDYAMTEWFKNNYGVRFEYPATGEDSTTQLTMLVATNQAPTLIVADGDAMPIYAVRGLVAPVDEYINDRDIVFLAETFDAYQWQGQRYAMQWASGATFRSVIYNQDAFKNVGLEDPWTRFKDDGRYTLEQMFDDSRELRTVNDAGEITQYGWSFTAEEVNYLLALNDTSIYARTSVNGMDSYTLQQDDPKVQYILQALDDAVQSGGIDYGEASVEDIVSGKRTMYNHEFQEAYRARGVNAFEYPPLSMVPLPNGKDAQGDYGLGLVPRFDGLLGMRTENPDIGYFWCWLNGDQAVGDSVIGQKDTVGGLRLPTGPPVVTPAPEESWPADIRDGYFFLKDVRAGKEGYRWIAPAFAAGLPGFGEAFADFCAEAYRDRGAPERDLAPHIAKMKDALDMLSHRHHPAPSEPVYPTIDFSRGMPACIIPNPALADIGGTIAVVNGTLEINLPTSIPSEPGAEGERVYPSVDLFYIKQEGMLFPAYVETEVSGTYTCASGGYDMIEVEICYVRADGTVIDNRVLVQSMEDTGAFGVLTWKHIDRDNESGIYLVVRMAAYDTDADGNPIPIRFAFTSLTFARHTIAG